MPCLKVPGGAERLRSLRPAGRPRRFAGWNDLAHSAAAPAGVCPGRSVLMLGNAAEMP